MSDTPTLGIWTVVTICDPILKFQVQRNGEAVGDPYIFKGHAVAAKIKAIRAEGLAVQAKIRRSY